MRSSSIINSTLAEIKLFVVGGGRARIVNSKLCLDSEIGRCVIAVEKGGHLQISDSEIGKNLRIYGPGDELSWLEVSNTEIPGKILPGLPDDTSKIVAKISRDDRKEIVLKHVSDVKYDNYTVTLSDYEAIHFSKSDICREKDGNRCGITLGTGAELSCTNSTFGYRLSLNHHEPYLTSIVLNDCVFYGPWRSVSP